MKFVAKQGTGGYDLDKANRNPPTTPENATSRWGNFRHKPSVQQALLTEQYQLCCYSELRADQEGLGYHIEHIENKSHNPSRTFDYTNLGASALESHDLSTFKAQGLEVFGGHARGKRTAVNMQQFVACHQQDCARFFAYLSDGRIVPEKLLSNNDKARSQYTIDTLNLNSPYLLTRRRQWWDELDKLFEEHSVKNWSLSHLAAIDLIPTSGCLSRFFSLTRQFFGSISHQVLTQHAPQLV